MRIFRAKDYADVSRKAANIIAAQIHLKPDCVLGLATGSSPVGTYKELIAKYEAGELDFSKVSTINLDEYVGLTKDHDQSYAYFMRTNLFDHVNIDQANCNIPNGMNPDAAGECARYDAVIDGFGGADLQLLGLGPNGHIGFNEPGSSLASGTRIKTLTEQTREDNARFFGGDMDKVPTHCITQGIGTIMKARHLILLAFGDGKAEAIAETVEGGVSSFCPASALQLHPHATVIVDEKAASKLRNKDYYRYAYDHKPAWQGI